MDASRYKFLSDKTLDTFRNSSEYYDETEELVQAYKADHFAYGKTLEDMLQDVLGYYVLPVFF